MVKLKATFYNPVTFQLIENARGQFMTDTLNVNVSHRFHSDAL